MKGAAATLHIRFCQNVRDRSRSRNWQALRLEPQCLPVYADWNCWRTYPLMIVRSPDQSSRLIRDAFPRSRWLVTYIIGAFAGQAGLNPTPDLSGVAALVWRGYPGSLSEAPLPPRHGATWIPRHPGCRR